jgi:hypothetical protein
MRTTLSIDDEAFAKARAYARARDLKLGEAVSELIHRAAAERLPMKKKNGAWVFELPAGTPKSTARQVHELMDDDQ